MRDTTKDKPLRPPFRKMLSTSEKLQDLMRDANSTDGLKLMGILKEIQKLELENLSLQDSNDELNSQLNDTAELRRQLKRFLEIGE